MKAVPCILSLALVVLAGCPQSSKIEGAGSTRGIIEPLPSCVLLMDWSHEGAEEWFRGIKDGDTYKLCGRFREGPVPELDCLMPGVDHAVMVEGQDAGYPHHLVVPRPCLDDYYGGISGACEKWNCESIFEDSGMDEAPCLAIPARREGTCESMWEGSD